MAVTSPDFPHIDEAIERTRARTAQTRAATEGVQPGSRPTPTSVQDTTQPRQRGIIGRTLARMNPDVTLRGTRRVASGAGRLGMGVAKRAVPAVATAQGIGDQIAPDATERFARRFNVSEPTGDGSLSDMTRFAALRAGGFASDLAENLSTAGGMIPWGEDGRGVGQFYRDADMPRRESEPEPQQRSGGIVQDARAGAGFDPDTASSVGDQARPRTVNQAGNMEPVTIDGDTGQEVMGEVDLGQLLDDRRYVPARGTGIIRNQRTGRTEAIAGGEREPEPEPPAESPQQQQRQRVQMPNMTLAMSARTMPQYLAQLTRAGQHVSDNQAAAGLERGIVRRRRAALEDREAEQRLGQGDIELSQARQLDDMLQDYLSLNDTNDPEGRRRSDIEKQLQTVRGDKKPTDTPRDRFLRALVQTLFSDLQYPEEREEAQAALDQIMEGYDARHRDTGAAEEEEPATQFEEGEVYTDADGNRARFVNGEWEEL